MQVETKKPYISTVFDTCGFVGGVLGHKIQNIVLVYNLPIKEMSLY